MPIDTDFSIESISEADFRELDHKVMGIVFSVHNHIGRLCDEKIYNAEIAFRCEEAGISPVFREATIRVSYSDFGKTYYIDLLIKNSLLVELKTVATLVPENRKQALNYLLLAGLKHGKLVNMRPVSVQYEFISTTLDHEQRTNFRIHDEDWRDVGKKSRWFKDLLLALLTEWGSFLETKLFYEAVLHFGGGKETMIKQIDLVDGTRIIGRQ